MGNTAITGVVERPRLNSILSSEIVRVCVVQGPSGAGKTTLLRSWAQQLDESKTVAWVSLGDGITSRQVFWQHVVASAERLGEMPRETAENVRRQLSASVDPVRIASVVLAVAGPAVLILDAYEHLGDVADEIDRDLTQLLHVAPQLRVIVTTRGPTALAEVALSDGVARVISISELALTADEVRQLITVQSGIDNDQLARSIAKATRGFPLTVRAVAVALAQLGHIPRVDSAEWQHVVAARLERLLPDNAAVQFVADTSVAPYVDENLALLLSGNPDTAQLLAMLEHNGFGRWIPYARNRPVFQYVETIRDTFRVRAADDSDRFRRSCIATAQWLLENDEVVDQALHLAIEGGDFALADRVFVSLVVTNPASYITDRFLPPLRRVPDAVLHEYPMLAFGLGLALMANPILRVEAPRAFSIAVESIAQPSYLEPAVDAFSHASMRAIARRLTREYPASARSSVDAAAMVDSIAPAVRDEHREHIGTVLRQLSFSIWQGGYLDEAISTANRSVAMCTKPASRNYSTVYSAAITAFAGDTRQASIMMSTIDAEAWPPELRSTSMNGLGLLAEAYGHLDAFEFAAASDVLHNSDPYMRTNEYWPFLTAAWVCTRRGLGHPLAETHRVAEALAATVAPPGVGDNAATQHLYAVLALASIAGGDHRAAARILEKQAAGSPFLAAARVVTLLAESRDRAAWEQASRSLELTGHTIRTRAEVQLAGAVAALRLGEPEQAWEWLSGAVLAWESYGPRLHLSFIDPRDRLKLREVGRERQSEALQRYLDVSLSATHLHPVVALSSREHVVLIQLAEHDSVRDLAQSLSVSPHTIKTQLQSIYRKLGVSSRRAALEVGHELGLLSDGP